MVDFLGRSYSVGSEQSSVFHGLADVRPIVSSLSEILKGVCNTYPRVHGLWIEYFDTILDLDSSSTNGSGKSFSLESAEILKIVWSENVEKCLLNSTHERKGVAFNIVEFLSAKLCPIRLNLEQNPDQQQKHPFMTVLSPLFLRTMINSLSSRSNYLHTQSKSTLEVVIATVKRDMVENDQLAVVMQLLTHGSNRFDKITATSSVSSLLQDFDTKSSVATYINFLMNQIRTLSASSSVDGETSLKLKDEFEADDEETATSNLTNNDQPVWAIEALYSIVKNSRVFKDKCHDPVSESGNGQLEHIRRILFFFLANGFFSVKPGSKSSSKVVNCEVEDKVVDECKAWMNEDEGLFCPTMSTSCRRSCASNFFHLVGELTLADCKRGRRGMAGSMQMEVDDPGYWAHFSHALWVLLESKTGDFFPVHTVALNKWTSKAACTAYSKCMELIATIRKETLSVDVLLKGSTADASSMKKKKKKGAEALQGSEREAIASFQLLLLQVGMQLREEIFLGDDEDDEDDDDSSEEEDDDEEDLEEDEDGLVNVMVELVDCYRLLFEGRGKTNESEVPVADVMVDILLSLMSRPSKSVREVVKKVFRTCVCSHMTDSSLNQLLEALSSAASGQEETSRTEDDDDEDGKPFADPTDRIDDNDRPAANSDDGLKMTAVSNKGKKEENSFSIKGVSDARQALDTTTEGNKKDQDDGNSDDESDGDIMVDENMDMKQMEMEDQALALMVRAGLEKKKQRETAKEVERQLQHFAHRILDLLEIFVQRSPNSPHTINMPMALLHTASLLAAKLRVGSKAMSSSGSNEAKSLLERVRSLLKNKVCKTSPVVELDVESLSNISLTQTKVASAVEDDNAESATGGEEVLVDLFLNSSRVAKKIKIVDCSDLASALKLFVIRVLLHNKKGKADADAQIIRIVCTLMENDVIDIMQKRSTLLHPSYIGDFVARNPSLSWALVPVLTHMCKSPPPAHATEVDETDEKKNVMGHGARKPFLRCECFRILGIILNYHARNDSVCHSFPDSKFLEKGSSDALTAALPVRKQLEIHTSDLMNVLVHGLESPELSKGKHVKVLLQYAKALMLCMKAHSVKLENVRGGGKKRRRGEKSPDLRACFQKTIESTNSDGVRAVAIKLLQMLGDGEDSDGGEHNLPNATQNQPHTKKKKKKIGSN